MTSLILALALPWAGAAAIALLDKYPSWREAAGLLAALGSMAAVLTLVISGESLRFALVEPWPGLALAWNTERFGLLFAMLASFLWVINSLYAIGYMRANHAKQQTRFYVFFAISMAAALALALAENLFTLFAAYEILTLATYPLVIHKQTAEARRGGAIYLAYLLGTSFAFLLPAIIWTWLAAGTLNFTAGGILAGHIGAGGAAALFALYVFGIGKAALMPLHRWLPEAMVAPTPVSALLHAVAVVKAGIFSVLKITAYIFGVDFLAATGAARWLIYAAGLSVIAASLIALTRDNLKERLAYSTVSQLAYAGLAAGLALPAALTAGAVHICAHALAKITLFMCAGAITTASGKTRISEMDGMGRRMKFTYAAFLIASLGIIGLPPLFGFWSKWFLILAATNSPDGYFVIGVLLASSLLNIAYLLPVGLRGFYFAPPPETQSTPESSLLLCVAPLCVTALCCLLLFFLIQPLAGWVSLFPATSGALP